MSKLAPHIRRHPHATPSLVGVFDPRTKDEPQQPHLMPPQAFPGQAGFTGNPMMQQQRMMQVQVHSYKVICALMWCSSLSKDTQTRKHVSQPRFPTCLMPSVTKASTISIVHATGAGKHQCMQWKISVPGSLAAPGSRFILNMEILRITLYVETLVSKMVYILVWTSYVLFMWDGYMVDVLCTLGTMIAFATWFVYLVSGVYLSHSKISIQWPTRTLILCTHTTWRYENGNRVSHSSFLFAVKCSVGPFLESHLKKCCKILFSCCGRRMRWCCVMYLNSRFIIRREGKHPQWLLFSNYDCLRSVLCVIKSGKRTPVARLPFPLLLVHYYFLELFLGMLANLEEHWYDCIWASIPSFFCHIQYKSCINVKYIHANSQAGVLLAVLAEHQERQMDQHQMQDQQVSQL